VEHCRNAAALRPLAEEGSRRLCLQYVYTPNYQSSNNTTPAVHLERCMGSTAPELYGLYASCLHKRHTGTAERDPPRSPRQATATTLLSRKSCYLNTTQHPSRSRLASPPQARVAVSASTSGAIQKRDSRSSNSGCVSVLGFCGRIPRAFAVACQTMVSVNEPGKAEREAD